MEWRIYERTYQPPHGCYPNVGAAQSCDVLVGTNSWLACLAYNSRDNVLDILFNQGEGTFIPMCSAYLVNLCVATLYSSATICLINHSFVGMRKLPQFVLFTDASLKIIKHGRWVHGRDKCKSADCIRIKAWNSFFFVNPIQKEFKQLNNSHSIIQRDSTPQ